MERLQQLEPIIYDKGDFVFRWNKEIGIESGITGLDYTKVLTVSGIEDIKTEDYLYQVIQFEGSESWHPALDYYPANFEDMEDYKKLDSEYKKVFYGDYKKAVKTVNKKELKPNIKNVLVKFKKKAKT